MDFQSLCFLTTCIWHGLEVGKVADSSNCQFKWNTTIKKNNSVTDGGTRALEKSAGWLKGRRELAETNEKSLGCAYSQAFFGE